MRAPGDRRRRCPQCRAFSRLTHSILDSRHGNVVRLYHCAACGAELFDAKTKFDSGTGWPSFTEPAVAAAVELRSDNSLFMRRTEVVCKRCGGHLGHVFDDGPRDAGGQRFCINGCALTLDKR